MIIWCKRIYSYIISHNLTFLFLINTRYFRRRFMFFKMRKFCNYQNEVTIADKKEKLDIISLIFCLRLMISINVVKIKNHRWFSSRASYRRITFVFSHNFWSCSIALIVDFRVSSISVSLANIARLYINISRLLSFSYRIVLYLFWYLRVYTITNCVLSISSKSWKTWICRRFYVFDENSDCLIDLIFWSRSTKLSVID